MVEEQENSTCPVALTSWFGYRTALKQYTYIPLKQYTYIPLKQYTYIPLKQYTYILALEIHVQMYVITAHTYGTCICRLNYS